MLFVLPDWLAFLEIGIEAFDPRVLETGSPPQRNDIKTEAGGRGVALLASSDAASHDFSERAVAAAHLQRDRQPKLDQAR